MLFRVTRWVETVERMELKPVDCDVVEYTEPERRVGTDESVRVDKGFMRGDESISIPMSLA